VGTVDRHPALPELPEERALSDKGEQRDIEARTESRYEQRPLPLGPADDQL
jgi:hypothetical protein